MVAVLVGYLCSGAIGHATPVNLLYFPLTNAPGNTFMPSSTGLGGLSVNLNSYSATGTALDFGGAIGSGVNGIATGARAMCLTNGAFATQPGQPFEPANATGGGSGANASDSAADRGDAALNFGAVHDFVVTMWFNQYGKMPSGSGFFGPRLFVLGTGGSPGVNDGSANSIGVKFQQANQFILSVNTTTLTTTYASDLVSNKWYFVAWVYDNTNIYQYTGSDGGPATLQNQFAAPGLTVNLGNPSTLVVGNRNYLGARGLNGWMEDFRFYTNVASAGNNAAFVESIRKEIAPAIPTVTGISPNGASLLQATNKLVFTAIAPSGFNLTNFNLVLNSVNVSAGLTFVTNGTAGTSTNVTATYTGLPQQSINTAVITVRDAIGLAGTASVTFDTFNPNNFIVKAEEFDYNNGSFIDNPAYTNVAEADSYFGLDSVEGIDTHKGGATAGVNDVNDYRFVDGAGTRTQTPLAAGELPSPTRFGGSDVPSHMVGNWSSGEWQNYTKTFPAGNYNVYARLSTSSGSTINMDQVTAGQGTANQTLSRLGSFTYTGNSSFQWVPLLQNGSLAVVNLLGQKTVRATSGGGANANFYMLVPANPNLPVINNVYPDGNYLFEATNKLVFTVSSAAGINTANVTLALNGTNVSAGLVFTGGPNTWNVSYTGLQLNQTYVTTINVTDNNSVSANATLNIDTWNPVMQVEAEGFDFDPTLSPIFNGTGNRYIDSPVPTAPGVPAANSYEGQVGITNIDEGGGASAAGHAQYRPNDLVATTPVTDLARRQFINGALDYNVGFQAIGMWQQYTKTWSNGTFNVYARVASGANQGTYYSSWSQVLGGWGSTNQVNQHIGSFAIPTTGGYSAYFYAPLIDQYGNYAQLTLGGTNTFRARHNVINQTENPNLANTSGGINVNFYMLVAPRNDLPRIDGVYPNGSLQQTNTFTFVASNPTYGIATNNIQVTLNGVNISAGLMFIGSAGSWNVSYPGLQLNTNYTATITMTDNNNQTHTTTVSFDTFSTNNFTWEAEDFDFNPAYSPLPNASGLRYIDHPVPTSMPATNSYYAQAGDFDVDYSSVFFNVLPVPQVYRSAAMNINNLIPIEVTTDALRQKYQTAQLTQLDPNIQDYDIFNATNSAWINYTRTFPTNNFYVYARLSAGTTGKVNLQCAQVTSGAGTSTQTTNVLGCFQATGNNFTTWQYAPLINTNTGVPILLALNGLETLQMTGDGLEHVNYFMLAPAVPNSVVITASVSGSNVHLSFPTQTGYTYTVFYKNDLADLTWTQLVGGGNPVTGNGLTQSVTDSLGQSHRFYRVAIQ